MMPIKGYDDYFVDETGNVWSSKKNPLGRKMSLSISNCGYIRVLLSNGIRKPQKLAYVHRLVAAAFIPNPDNLPCVNHKNSDRTDNRVENLEWCTHSQNIRHSWDAGRCEEKRKNLRKNGLKRGSSLVNYARLRRKLTNDDIRRVKSLYPSMSQSNIANIYGVTQATIWKILNNQTYKDAA